MFTKLQIELVHKVVGQFANAAFLHELKIRSGSLRMS